MKLVKSTSRDPVTAYARKVVQGKILAGSPVRAACQRHLNDLERAASRGFFFDLEKVERVVGFFHDVLRLNGGEYEGEPYRLLDWQAFVAGSLFGWVDAEGFRRFQVAYIETAKGPLSLDTPIATVGGWTTMGEIIPGDYVFDDKGRPTEVVAVSEVFYDRECYKLTFSDGVEIVADAEHRWSTAALRSGMKPGPRNDGIRKGGYAKRSTAEIAGTLQVKASSSLRPQAKWNHRVDVAPALDLPEIDLPIPPYTLGAWLGDGDSDASRITSADEEVCENILADGLLLGRRQHKPGTTAWRQSIGVRDKTICCRGHGKESRSEKTGRCLACERTTDRARRRGMGDCEKSVFTLQEMLRSAGLINNKHIPDVYFRSSKSQRLSLLQGLMDTDGTVAFGGKCEITLCSKSLAFDTLDLIRTLGFKALARESEAKLNGRVVGKRWRIGFQAYTDMQPFRISRKSDRLSPAPDTRALSRGRMIVGCEKVQSVPVRCITVEAESHMFLAGEGLVPTCNSGKSPLVAGIGLYGLVADGEMRAEVYAAATKKDQAMILFRDAVAMVDQSPVLLKEIKKSGRGDQVWNLQYLKSGGFFKPISSDEGQSGPRPHIGLIDEVHEHKTAHAINMMVAGFKFRNQPLVVMITNSGSDKKSPCGVRHDYGIKVSGGQIIDDRQFAYICSLDTGDDPFKSEKCWGKVNPSLRYGLPKKKYLRAQVKNAIGMPSDEAVVRRLNFCEWTEAHNPWISSDVWNNARRVYDWRDLAGRRAYGGLDLGSTTDLTGLVLWIEPIEAGEPWHLVSFAWLPEEGLGRKEDMDKVPYFAWKTAGLLKTTPGRAISKRFILQHIVELGDIFDIQCIAYDRWRMQDLIQMAADDGYELPELVAFGQGYKDMSPALEMFETALLNNEVVHDGHPIMTMCAANAVTTQDPAGNRKMDKIKATGRIDLMVAAVMGAGVALSNKQEEQNEVGIFVL